MRSAALATAIALLTRSDHAGAAEIAVDQGDGTMCAGDFCFPAPPTPFVSSLSPAHGPLDGGTDVVVVGSGFRDFGELMRCRFGTQKMSASLTAPEGEFIDATNHWAVGCHSPSASSEYEQAVGVEVALNGEEFTDGGAMFAYYRHPILEAVSPSRGSASKSQLLTVTRSTAMASGAWAPGHLVAPPNVRCRFEAVKDPDGHRQVTYVNTTAATAASETEIQCRTPEVNFLGTVTVEVTINGLDYSAGGGAVFTYADHWHAPRASGSYVPREGMAAAVLGDAIYLFGGVDHNSFFEVSGPFTADFFALHTDAMKDVYPSRHAEDLTWQKIGLVAGGEAPPPRTKASLVAWGNALLLFGGLADHNGEAYNETRLYHGGRQAWEPLSVSGGPIAKRSAHTAHVCSHEVNCTTVDGKPRMFVFGGWGLKACGHHKHCLRHHDDLWALDLTTMDWSEVPVNPEQPRPHARKDHSAAVVNGSQLIVFGGSAFVPDGDEYNSYGWTTKQVNDVWRIDLSGADGFTWHPVHTVGDRPRPREGQASSLLEGRYLVVHGGYAHPEGDMSGASGLLESLHVLDTALDPMLWTQPALTGESPGARHGHAALNVGGEIYTIGGFGDDGYYDSLNLLQLLPDSAPAAPPTPPPPPE